jgi:hypothetical protein
LGLQTNLNADGHLKTDLQRCRVLLSDLHFDFQQADSDLIRNYIPFIHRAVRDQIDNVSLFCFLRNQNSGILNVLFLTTLILVTLPNFPRRTCSCDLK